MTKQSEAVATANAKRRKDITGHVFHKLTVVGYDDVSKKWNCICECGGTAKVMTAALNNGNTKSCGCYQKKRASESALTIHKKRRLEQGVEEDQFLSSRGVIERQEFKSISLDILKRDSYTCTWCSTVGGELNVHHIDPWSTNIERRFDRTNVVTLCKECHVKVHRGNFLVEPDPHMSILLEGYAKEIEAICQRVELT